MLWSETACVVASLFGHDGANLRLAADELLVGAQHRAGGRVGALLEEGAGGGGVSRARLRALQTRRPPALRRIRVRRLQPAI